MLMPNAPVIPDPRPRAGPFYTAVVSSVIGGAVLAALLLGMPMNMTTVLTIVLPGMTTATTLIAVAMGWIFIMVGRTRQTPKWVGGTAVMIVITMAEMFALTYLTSLAPTLGQ
jgi:predicted lipid-binding transport protein (Tim44 family)